MKNKIGSRPFGLYVILTDPVTGYDACARAAVNQGVRFVQLRMKHAEKEEILETARAIRTITAGTDTRFIVNDFVDIAMETGADGVHLGQDDVALADARKIWNDPNKIFGLSTHNPTQAKDALLQNPDYIGVGPVFPTPTKAIPDPVVGTERMGQIIASTPLPAVAIGGIDESNLEEVLKKGAKNFCAVRAIMQSREPEAVIQRMMAVWRKHQQERS